MEQAGLAIPKEQATGPSPKAEKDAEGQEGVEGDEALNLKRGVEKFQDVGEDPVGKV